MRFRIDITNKLRHLADAYNRKRLTITSERQFEELGVTRNRVGTRA